MVQSIVLVHLGVIACTSGRGRDLSCFYESTGATKKFCLQSHLQSLQNLYYFVFLSWILKKVHLRFFLGFKKDAKAP